MMINKIEKLKKYVNDIPFPNEVSMYDKLQIGNKGYNKAIDDVIKLLNMHIVTVSLLSDKYDKLQKDYDIIKLQYEKRGNRIKKMISKYDLPINIACLDSEQ